MSNRVTSLNPFDLLSDDPRPTPAPKPAAAPAKPAAAKPAAAKPAATTAKPAAPQKDQPKGNNVQKTGDQQKKSDAPKPRRSPAQPQNGGASPVASGADDRAIADKPERSRGGDRREGGRGRGGDRPQRGRTYDRRSGTGRPPTESKKDNAGKGNWGTAVDAETEAAVNPEEGVEKEETAEVADATPAPAPAAEEPPKEPEKETLGYDEYVAKLKEKAPKFETLKPREIDADDLQKAGFTVLKRVEEESTVKKKTPKAPKESASKDAAAPKEKVISADQIINFSQRFEDNGRGRGRGNRGGRGGRGGSRGGGGDRERGDRKPSGKDSPSQPEFKIEENAFPSLGGSGGFQSSAAAQAPTKA